VRAHLISADPTPLVTNFAEGIREFNFLFTTSLHNNRDGIPLLYHIGISSDKETGIRLLTIPGSNDEV
jgi:hypothetical protein